MIRSISKSMGICHLPFCSIAPEGNYVNWKCLFKVKKNAVYHTSKLGLNNLGITIRGCATRRTSLPPSSIYQHLFGGTLFPLVFRLVNILIFTIPNISCNPGSSSLLASICTGPTLKISRTERVGISKHSAVGEGWGFEKICELSRKQVLGLPKCPK